MIILIVVLFFVIAYVGSQTAPTINDISRQRGNPLIPEKENIQGHHERGCVVALFMTAIVLLILAGMGGAAMSGH